MNTTQKKRLFCAALDAVRGYDKIVDQLDKIGFDIDRGVCGQLIKENDVFIKHISESLDLLPDSQNYTPVDWWWESVLGGCDPVLKLGDEAWSIETPEQLWEYLVAAGIIRDEVEA